jgi:hypothetical protein
MHLQSFLDVLARNLHIEPATKMSIWDPFYCDGSTKRIFNEIGFLNVVHENVNFYELIRERKILKYDILVTNPPYSDDHIDRLLDFVITNEVPRKVTSCLLLPNWVSRKSDYQSKFVKSIEDANYELLYLAPLEPYTYTMPTWVSEKDRPEHVGGDGQTTPYLSSWYLIVPKLSKKHSLLVDKLDIISKQQKPPIWVVSKTVKGIKWKVQKAGQRIKGTGKRNKKSKRGKKQIVGTNLFTGA